MMNVSTTGNSRKNTKFVARIERLAAVCVFLIDSVKQRVFLKFRVSGNDLFESGGRFGFRLQIDFNFPFADSFRRCAEK